MLLILTNKIDKHTDVVIERLYKSGIPFFRWNTEDFPSEHQVSLQFSNDGSLGNNNLIAEGRQLDFREVQAVWNRRPGETRIPLEVQDAADREFATRETQFFLRGLWASLKHCFWVNEPLANQRMGFKLLQLELAGQVGLLIPPTLVTTEPKEVLSFIEAHKNIIAKPLSGGFIHRDEITRHIYTNRVTTEHLAIIENVKAAPTLFQKYIPKKLELRITIIDDKVFACAIDSQQSDRTRDDWRRYDFDNVPHLPWTLPDHIAEKLQQMMRWGGLHFGAFDLVLTPEDEYIFLELNPNGQWYWIEELTGMPITDSLVNLFGKHITTERGESYETFSLSI